jgi:hypothetical protein
MVFSSHFEDEVRITRYQPGLKRHVLEFDKDRPWSCGNPVASGRGMDSNHSCRDYEGSVTGASPRNGSGSRRLWLKKDRAWRRAHLFPVPCSL